MNTPTHHEPNNFGATPTPNPIPDATEPAAITDKIMRDASAAAQPTAEARVVAYAPGRFVAFAPHATQELLENPQFLVVPGAAYYGYGLLHWQNRHIPLIHLESVIKAYPAFDAHTAPAYALILAYQTQAGAPIQYGAIAVADIPTSITVSNSDFAPLPKDSDMWGEFSVSCFKRDNQHIPIIDVARMFGQYHG